MMNRRFLQLCATLLLSTSVIVSTFGPTASAANINATDAIKSQSPIVIHTGEGPTGYTVTFKYQNPEANRVQIKGEWYFARPGDLSQIAGTTDKPVVETQGLLPSEWQPGDIPIASPNATAANWPVIDMTKNEDGIWTYTTPLPSGTFSYSYFLDCQTEDQSGCTPISDPSNSPWNEQNGVVLGSLQTASQVFVPSDPKFNTVDYWWQGPAVKQGTISHQTYTSPGHESPADKNYLVVYTPPGYDSKRTEPYPTLYLSHGGGGNENDWITQGALANIMDNLISTGEIQSMVVVMPNAGGYPNSTFYEAYNRDLIDNMIPFIEKKYNVSSSSQDRAFSGLSMGGIITNSLMLKYPEQFGYFGMMSGGLPPEYEVLNKEQADSLIGKGIFIGSAWQDPIHAVGFRTSHFGPAREVNTLINAGVPVTPLFINGGHEWYVWRILLKDFLTDVAFQPLPYIESYVKKQSNNTSTGIKVLLNGELQQLKQLPIAINNEVVLVPLREVFERLQAKVTWNATSNNIDIVQGQQTIKIKLAHSEVYVNNQKVNLSQPLLMIEGKLMAPLELIKLASNVKASWNVETQTVSITNR